MAAASCQKEAQPCGPEQVNLVLSTEIAEISKTYLQEKTVLWGTGEYVYLWYNDGQDKFVKSNSSSAASNKGKSVASFDFTLSVSSAGSYSFGGIYPNSSVVGTPKSASAAIVELPDMQYATSTSYDPDAFIMVLRPEKSKTMPKTLTAYFRRAVALNEITLQGLKGTVSSFTVSAQGKNIAGQRSVDLTTGKSGLMVEPGNTITVNFSTPLSPSAAVVRFTSWGFELTQGQKMTVRVTTSEGVFEKTITAQNTPIVFEEGKLNQLGIKIEEAHQDILLADFAKSFVTVLDAWESNKDDRGHIVPSNFSFKLGEKTYGRTAMYDVALQGFVSLYGGGKLSDKIPQAHSYSWAASPYSETSGSGGPFILSTVGLDFLRNYSSRQIPYAKSNSQWANFCTYNGAADASKGTPSISAVCGCCCIERSLLMFARFYKYLLDNKITENIATACSKMELDASLYSIPVSGSNIAMWLNRSDMNTINLETYKAKGVSHILLHEYAFKYYTAASVKTFITKAHSLGMKVHIWMQCFWWNDDTGWRLPVIDRKGSTKAKYNQALFDEIIGRAETYLNYNVGIDGLHCDYIRFGGTASQHNFPDDGITATGAITEFSRQFSAAAKKIKPDVILSAAMMGETSPQKDYGQEPNQMNAYFSIFMPMAYISSYGYTAAQNVAVADWFVNRAAPSEVWHGIATYNSQDKGLSADQIHQDCSNIAKNSKAQGIALFRYGIGTIPDLTDIWK